MVWLSRFTFDGDMEEGLVEGLVWLVFQIVRKDVHVCLYVYVSTHILGIEQ